MSITKRNHYVYKIILEGSDRYYIGRRSTKKEPIQDKYMGSGNWVRSIKDKYRLSKVILEVFDSFDDLLIGEEKWITEHFKDPNNMNILYSSTGAAAGSLNHNYGKKHTDETKHKISEAHKGRKHSAESRKNMSKAGQNRVVTEETKLKISEARKGRKHSAESRKNMSISTSGENAPHAKLINAQVLEIRYLWSTGKFTQKFLSKHYNVNISTISMIINRKIWKYI